MVFRILENTDSTLVVHLESGSLLCTISKFRKDVLDGNNDADLSIGIDVDRAVRFNLLEAQFS